MQPQNVPINAIVEVIETIRETISKENNQRTHYEKAYTEFSKETGTVFIYEGVQCIETAY